MKKRALILPVLVLTVFSALVFSESVSAATVPSTVKYKAAYEGVYQCFKNNAYFASFKASEGGQGMLLNKLSGDTVKLPYGLTDATDNNTNCQEILKGFNSNARSDDNLRAGLLGSGIWSSNSAITTKNYFAGTNGGGGVGTMGFKAEGLGNVESGQSTQKLTIGFDPSKLNSETCRKKSGNTTIIGTQGFYKDGDSGNPFQHLIFPTVTKDNKNGNWFVGNAAINSKNINVPEPGSGGVVMYYFCNDESIIQINDAGSIRSPYYNIYITFTEYGPDGYGGISSYSVYNWSNELAIASGDHGWDYTANTGLFKGTIIEGDVTETGDFDDYKLTYLKLDGEHYSPTYMRSITKLSATSAAGYNLSLTSSSTYDALKLTDPEIYSLYTYYVKDVFRYPVLCDGDENFSAYNDSNSTKIRWAIGKTCRIDTNAISTQPSYDVYGIDNNTKHFTKKVTIDDVVVALIALPDNVTEQVSDAETGGNIPDGTISGENTDTPGSNTTNPPSEVSTLTACYAGAGVLGWIACPILKVMSEFASTMYGFIEQSLEVSGNVINSGGLYSGWEIFRNFANIIFAIFFVIIILAQITGIGISNYNIKKILPRLVVIVVLVNISFIICQLAVDISNILGVQFKALFDGLATRVAAQNGGVPFNLGTVFGGILGSAFAVGTSIAVVGVLAITIPVELWLFPLILTVLGCLLGILFFFIIIGVRQAAIIVLIALAPVAIICYALPNTKPFFDRWRKLFTALLLVYPICGLLMGGGTFASTLLLQSVQGSNDSNGFLVIVAMLMTVVPFFMIPSLLRNSMAAMGNLGAKISNFGKDITSNANRAIRNSEIGRNIQRDAQMRYDERAAKKLEARVDKLGEKNKSLSAQALRRRAYLHRSAANHAYAEDYRAQAMAGSIAPDTPTGKAMLENLRQEQLATETKNMRSVYEGSGEGGIDVNSADELGKEYFNQLEALHANPTSRDALTKVRALQDIMMESDAGRTQIKNQQLRHALQHQADYNGGKATTGDSALSLASAHMLAAHQAEIKRDNRGTWSMQQDFAQRKFSSLFENAGISQLSNETYGSTYYETKGLDGYDENTLASADEDVLKSINRAISNETIDPAQKAEITALAGQAYGKDGLNVQGKVGKQLRSAIINGNNEATIGGLNAKTLNRLAENIQQNLIPTDSDEGAKLVQMARQALESKQVLDSTRAAALNSILAAAGQEQVPWSGEIRPNDQNGSTSGDSGPLHGSTSGDSSIITAGGGASIDELRRKARGK